MEIKRITEIFVQKKRQFVIHPLESSETAEHIECQQCDAPMLTAENIAVLLGISCRNVYRLVETGAPHFAETPNGYLYGCPDSFAEVLVKMGGNYEDI